MSVRIFSKNIPVQAPLEHTGGKWLDKFTGGGMLCEKAYALAIAQSQADATQRMKARQFSEDIKILIVYGIVIALFIWMFSAIKSCVLSVFR